MAFGLEVMMTYGGEVSVNTVRLAPEFRGLEKKGGKPGWIMTSDEDWSFRSLSLCVCYISAQYIMAVCFLPVALLTPKIAYPLNPS